MCELAQMLPEAPQAFKDEFFATFGSYGYTIPRRGRKTEVWCQCCGHRHLTRGTLVELTDYVCPSCGAHLELRCYPSRDDSQHIEKHFVAIVDTFGGLQLVRTFQLERINIGDFPTRLSCVEVFQNWAAPNGREIITTRPYTRSVFGGELFRLTMPYVIGRHNASYTGQYAFEDMFDFTRVDIWNKRKVLPELKRDGFDAKFIMTCIRHGTNFIKLAAAMSKDKMLVTMLKVGYQRLALRIVEDNLKFQPHIVKILHRNHYEIKDVAMYCDYISDCEFCGVDTHNAFYVCPADLREAHQRMRRKRDRIEGERKLQQKRAKIASEEPKYQKLRAAFLGLEFTTDDIRVFTAPSVESVFLEGAAMHHCVFDMDYYMKESSLIMFARDAKTGDRLETVEVNLRTFSIAQSRGLQNNFTPQHQQIVKLVQDNMPQIRQCCRQRAIQSA